MKQWKFRSRNSKSIRFRDFSTEFQKDSSRSNQININSYKLHKDEHDSNQKLRVNYTEIQVHKDLNDHTLVSWGSGKEGSLGTSSLEDSSAPQTIHVFNSKQVKQVVCGAGNTLALTSDNLVFSWGFNSVGQLGLGHFKNCSVPCVINFTFEVVHKIVSGAGHCMVINTQGEIFSWGCAGYYQTGHQQLIHNNLPVKIAFFEGICVSDAACGISHSLVLANSVLYAFGDNFHGQCTGRESYFKVPKMLSVENVQKIAAGGAHSLVLFRNGTVFASGLNSSGQLGVGHKEDVAEFVEVRVKDCVEICAGEEISAGISRDGKVFVWGWNGFGQLGQGHFADILFPTLLKMNEKVKKISLGVAAAGFLTERNELYWTGYLGACLKKEMKEKSIIPDKQLALPHRFLDDATVTLLALGRTHCVLYINEILKAQHNDSYEVLDVKIEKIALRPKAVLPVGLELEPLRPIIKEKLKLIKFETFEEKDVNRKVLDMEEPKESRGHVRETSLDSAIRARKNSENLMVTLLAFQKSKEEGREIGKNFRLFDEQLKLPPATSKPVSEDKLMLLDKKSSKKLHKIKSFDKEKVTSCEFVKENTGNYFFPNIVQMNVMQQQRIRELETVANRYDKKISSYYQPISPKVKNIKVSKRIGGGYLG